MLILEIIFIAVIFVLFSKGRGMNCKDCEANNFKNHKCILYTKSENYDEKRSAFYKL